jgi:predicted RNase H-like HicB family nuclease
MEFRAVIKRRGEWWIGWLVNIPGVNGQERTKEDLIESLKIGAEDMINTPYTTKKEEELVCIKV